MTACSEEVSSSHRAAYGADAFSSSGKLVKRVNEESSDSGGVP
ncbi:hypothetical protein ACIBO5_23105 [Nonomuraea angiospora]|nr:hypothetical protein [Nonomuraea angiospora]MDX3106032.1 hypothetical protein [Nonomuraea angiospora]